jgi:hypothetical protein
MPFCTNCGTKIESHQRFCGSCGMSIAGSLVTPEVKPLPFNSPSPQVIEPMILAVLPQITKPKFGLADNYTMVFTRDSLILAKLTNAVMKDVIQRSQAASKAAGKGWMGKVSDQMKAFYSAHLRYNDMAPEAILAEDKDNFVIPYSTVTYLKIKTKISGGDDDGPGDELLELEFDTSSGKYKFNCANVSKETRAIFTNFFGPKIRY